MVKTAFRCQQCGGPVEAQNELAYKLLMSGHPALCAECRNPKPKQWDSYEEYLLSPEWRAKANERKRLDGYQCRICESKERLECHHRTYDRLYDERIEDLTTLCHIHHWLVTAYENGLIALPEEPQARPQNGNGRQRVYLPPITIG